MTSARPSAVRTRRPPPRRPRLLRLRPPLRQRRSRRRRRQPAIYPNAIDPKYAKETAGKARLHTCVDQYNANKTTNGNGGMKWIEKGGGYYSECNKKLKGAA
jgi:hypothetical protein